MVPHEGARAAFHKWLKKHAAADEIQLELAAATLHLEFTDGPAAEAEALALHEKFLGAAAAPTDELSAGGAALAAMREKGQDSIGVLSETAFPKFIQSKGCMPLMELLISQGPPPGTLWPQYRVPDDVAGWVAAFCSVASAFPAAVSLVDMGVNGRPLLFVNDAFTWMTGFTREDCLGRNCRFLQGPKSEPQSVGVIQNTLAKGVDCAVRITNYKKSGEAFEQLLARHPILDTSDRYRFCFGVHYEITPALPLKTIVAKISKLIKTLPSKLYAPP